ncbi:MAG: hypothetical protein ABSE73_04805 [Planctomycetota bacterium]
MLRMTGSSVQSPFLGAPASRRPRCSAAWLAVAWLLHFWAGAQLRAGEAALQTELKVLGPAVSISAPLGLRYRPGMAFPLQVRVHNPGPAFRGELFLTEGRNGPRYGFSGGLDFPAHTARVFTLPVRAPTVAANLELVLRELSAAGAEQQGQPGLRPAQAGSVGPMRFQASLARVLKPLPPDARIIVSCGARTPLSFGPQEEVAEFSARELPDEEWWYENVDLVVLGDGSFKDAPPAAQLALRLWLLGGGRLFIASQEALSAAIGAQLLPLDAQAAAGVIGADLGWWEEHAGLKPDGILAQKNNRPVYIALPLGFGETALLFPATSAEDAREYGAAVANHPLLQRARDRFPDVRVQPDRFTAFAPGTASPALRSAAALWILLGAVAFCLGLALAYSSRSRLVAVGWPLAVAALLAVLLVRWFPERALAVSRLQLVRQAADARAVVTDEWALVEAFNEPASIAVTGLATPLYADTSELNSTQADLAWGGAQPQLQTVVQPDRPALFTAAKVELPSECDAVFPTLPAGLLRCRGQDIQLRLPDAATGSGLRFRNAIWARADGALCWLKDVDAGGSFELASYEDALSHVRKPRDAGYGGALGQAHAEALKWAAQAVQRGRRETIIFWEQVPGENSGRIELGPPAPNAGTLFRILAVETHR